MFEDLSKKFHSKTRSSSLRSSSSNRKLGQQPNKDEEQLKTPASKNSISSATPSQNVAADNSLQLPSIDRCSSIKVTPVTSSPREWRSDPHTSSLRASVSPTASPQPANRTHDGTDDGMLAHRDSLRRSNSSKSALKKNRNSVLSHHKHHGLGLGLGQGHWHGHGHSNDHNDRDQSASAPPLSNRSSKISVTGDGSDLWSGYQDDSSDMEDAEDDDRTSLKDVLEGEEITGDRWLHSGSIMLAEARADTPAFRASIEFLDLQFKSLEKWLFDLNSASRTIETQMGKVKDSVNDLIKLFMPSMTHASILAHDYTTLLFGRYTEAMASLWTDLLSLVARNSVEIRLMVDNLEKNVLSKYNALRRDYLQALKEQDDTFALLLRMPDHSEPAALREVSLNTYKARRNFLKAATHLVVGISELEGTLTVSLLETLSSQFLDVPDRFQSMDPEFLEVGSEFYRLKSVAKELKASIPGFKTQLMNLRAGLLKTLKAEKPPTSLKIYREVEPPAVTETTTEKFGWVNVEVKPGTWSLYWAYLKNGLFGFLGQSSNGTAVIESVRFPVHLCKFDLVSARERTFVFKISSPEHTVLTQALGRFELAQWQAAFDGASKIYKEEMELSRNDDAGATGGKDRVYTHDRSARELLPWNLSFAIAGFTTTAAPGSDAVVARIDEIRHDLASPQWLRYGSTITGKEHSAMGNTVPAVKPMPTSVMLEAVTANSYFRPEGVPNAISSNLWGCLSGNIAANKDTKSREVAHYSGHFPRYPNNFPRGLVVQDLDLRTIVAHLPVDEKLRDDDFLLFFIRATMDIRDKDLPVRIYVTGQKLVIYASWIGFVYLQSFEVESILEIEASQEVDFSRLEITLQDPRNREDGMICLRFKLYIDSSALAKSQLELVLKNRRSRSPLPCRELIEPLAYMRIQYASELKKFEHHVEEDVLNGRHSQYEPNDDDGLTTAASTATVTATTNTSASTSTATNDNTGSGSGSGSGSGTVTARTSPEPVRNHGSPQPPTSSSSEKRNISHTLERSGRHDVASWLLRAAHNAASEAREGIEPNFNSHGKQTKVATDTSPLPAKALFTIMFGPRSTVFSGRSTDIIESENIPGPWYRKGSKLERRILHKMRLGSSISDRYSYQRIEKQEGDVFVVNQRLSAWEMPRGDQFYTALRYVIYSTEQGSHLQIWSRVIWLKLMSGEENDDALKPINKVLAQAILVRVREAANKVNSVEDAYHLYGRVKPAKVLKPNESHEDRHEVTQVTSRTMAMVISRSPFYIWKRRIKWVILNFFYGLLRLSSPVIFVVIILVLSLFTNYRLYHKSRQGYWQAHLEQQEINESLDRLNLSLDPSKMVFQRAIYLKDIDDMIRDGTFWAEHHFGDNSSVSLQDGVDEGVDQRYGCSQKFNQLAQISSSGFETLHTPEPHMKEALDRFTETRLNYATRRNELLTMMRVLNLRERESLLEQYREWVINEATMCSRVRPAIPLLNSTVNEHIKNYCVACLEEARHLI